MHVSSYIHLGYVVQCKMYHCTKTKALTLKNCCHYIVLYLKRFNENTRILNNVKGKALSLQS
jgi:hypothetical protein